jgi:antitoxin HicB
VDRDANVYQFAMVIDRQPEGGYLVTVPALPGCFTEVRIWEEAYETAADAIRAYCSSLLKHGGTDPGRLVGRAVHRATECELGDSVMPRLPAARACLCFGVDLVMALG